MITLLLTKQIVQLFLIMLCGYLLVRAGLLKASDSKVLSILIVYIICPCTILNAFQISFTPETANNFLLSFACAISIHVLLFVIVYLLSNVFRFTGIEKASLIYSNAGNLIIPLVTAVLGEEWVIYASAFMVVQLFIIWTHGKSLVEGKWAMDMKSILTNVNLIACLIGLVLFLLHLQLPGILKDTVKSIGSTIGPVSMMMLGMILAGVDLVQMVKGKRIWLITFLKMIAIPALVIVIMKFSGLASMTPDGQTILFISLMATMTPAATTVTQMAQLYDKEVSYATAINTITTIVCLVTMPLLTMLYYL